MHVLKAATKTLVMSQAQNVFRIPSPSISPCFANVWVARWILAIQCFIQRRCALSLGAQVSGICSVLPDAAAAYSGDGQGQLCIGGS